MQVLNQYIMHTMDKEVVQSTVFSVPAVLRTSASVLLAHSSSALTAMMQE